MVKREGFGFNLKWGVELGSFISHFSARTQGAGRGLGLDLHSEMAGDSERRLQDQEENGNAIRQPFIIGVSGGTASGKVPMFTFLY